MNKPVWSIFWWPKPEPDQVGGVPTECPAMSGLDTNRWWLEKSKHPTFFASWSPYHVTYIRFFLFIYKCPKKILMILVMPYEHNFSGCPTLGSLLESTLGRLSAWTRSGSLDQVEPNTWSGKYSGTYIRTIDLRPVVGLNGRFSREPKSTRRQEKVTWP